LETEVAEILSKEGKITRPEWFENSRVIRARATISAGTARRERVYQLRVLPAEMPDYTGREFEDYLKIGSSASEHAQAFAAHGAEEHSRFIGGKSFSYRTLEEDDIMAMSMKTEEESKNYLTIKVWKTQQPTAALRIENLEQRDLEPLTCVYPAELPQEDGFLYLTYPIPTSWTEGKSFISFRLFPEETDAEEWIPWEIYGVYTGQTSYFDPLTFAEQGERVVGKQNEEDSAFIRLLRRMYLAAKRPWEDFTQRWKGEEAGEIPETEALPTIPATKDFVWMETNPPILAFEEQNDQIAVSVLEADAKAQIHRASDQYDTYAESTLHTYSDGLRVIDYGIYQIIRNDAGRERRIPWEAEGFAGIYQDIVNDKYYAFLQEGQMADDSVLPVDAALHTGDAVKLSGGKTIILKQLSKPLYHAEWRISEIDGVSVSKVKLNQDLQIAQVTVKNIGSTAVAEEELRVLCLSYEEGKIAGMNEGVFHTVPGREEYQVNLTPMIVKAGQTLKIFIETSGEKAQTMTPKLELP